MDLIPLLKESRRSYKHRDITLKFNTDYEKGDDSRNQALAITKALTKKLTDHVLEYQSIDELESFVKIELQDKLASDVFQRGLAGNLIDIELNALFVEDFDKRLIIAKFDKSGDFVEAI